MVASVCLSTFSVLRCAGSVLFYFVAFFKTDDDVVVLLHGRIDEFYCVLLKVF